MGQTVTDVGVGKRAPTTELKKHAATIHCSNALSLLQRKISNALLYHAYKELMLKEEHEITVKQLCRLIGYHGHNHAAIREALKGLISTVIEWNIVSDVTGNENWTASSIIASVSLEGPLCFYAYSPRMKQLLHSPSMFGKIDLVIQSKFRSSYGLALYENCIRYRGLPYTKWFDMETFKKLMGVSADVYTIFRDFKRRVLDKAIDEVNMYSDLTIAPDYAREGRKVIKIRFALKERAKKTRLGSSMPIQSHLKDKLIQEFELSEEQVAELFSHYESGFIEEKIAIVEAAKPYQEGRVKNRAGYLLSAIRQNYQMPKSLSHEIVNLEEAKLALEQADLKRQVEFIREEYDFYRERKIKEAIASLTPAERERFMSAFNTFAHPTISTILQLQRQKYNRETVLDSPQVQALLRQFALRELDGLTITSLEEFVGLLDEEKRDAWQKLKSFDPDHDLLRA